MRLWHQSLLPYLDNKRLLAQHRECCALRGKGWGKKHSVVDYVFKYDLAHLYEYHRLVMNEMSIRGYMVNNKWWDMTYRGKNLRHATLEEYGKDIAYSSNNKDNIYAEHNDKYLKECLLNLKAKGAELKNGKTIDSWLVELDLKGIV